MFLCYYIKRYNEYASLNSILLLRFLFKCDVNICKMDIGSQFFILFIDY